MQQNYQPCFCPKTTDKMFHEAQGWFFPSVSKGRAQGASNARGGRWEKWVQNVLVCGNTVESREGEPRARIQVLKRVSALQSCPTLWDPKDSSPPGSSVHRILQARILEWVWVAISFSRGSSQPRNRTQVSCIASRFFTVWASREAQGRFYWTHLQYLWVNSLDFAKAFRFKEVFPGRPSHGVKPCFWRFQVPPCSWFCLYEEAEEGKERQNQNAEANRRLLMLLNYGVEENSWESLGLQGDPTSPC